ncbi:MAG: hyaluronan synthase [Actinomycetota bacterium]|jgi:hyaluronan synthase|nr:hyaluronan synthase [Actinomycetota bacterium]
MRDRWKYMILAAVAGLLLLVPVGAAWADTQPVVPNLGGLIDNGGTPPPPPSQSPPSTAPAATPPAAPSPAAHPAVPPPASTNRAPAKAAVPAAAPAAPVTTAVTPPATSEQDAFVPVGDEAVTHEVAVADSGSPAVLVPLTSKRSSPVVATVLGAIAALLTERALARGRAALAARRHANAELPEFITAGTTSRKARNVQAAAMFAVALTGVLAVTAASGGGIRSYGFVAVGYLAVKLVLSSRYRPHVGNDEVSSYSVAAIVPVYNEDPSAFRRCLDSLLAQSHALSEIWVIDDGSSSPVCLNIARDMLRDVPGARVRAFRHNRGKREAQAFAFKRSQVEVFCTIDSDTVLDPRAVEEGLKPFANEKIMAVTGNVRALNHRKNLLTKLIDLRYANAFLYERAAYSMLGSVLCACGSLSFWRAEVIKDNLDDFVNQTFLGIPVQYGDDRRLTNYALQRGKVVVQDSSVAFTVVPERMQHFVRQQLRWNKSFFRETLWVLRNFSAKRWVWWLSLAEIAMWATFSTGIVMATLVTPLLTGRLALLYYLSYLAVMSYARSVRYFGASETSWGYQLYVFLLSPVYAVLHVGLLIPLRLWALLTLRQRGWGTRATVEVALTSGDAATPAPTLSPALVGVAA